MPTGPIDDFLGFLDDDALEVPHVISTTYPREVGGHTYRIPQPDALTGTRLAALGEIIVKQGQGVEVNERDVKRLSMNDDEEREFAEQVLGDVHQEMIDDGVNHRQIQVVLNYAFIAFAFNEDTARKMAADGELQGKPVPAANRAARRASTRKAPSRSSAPRRPAQS